MQCSRKLTHRLLKKMEGCMTDIRTHKHRPLSMILLLPMRHITAIKLSAGIANLQISEVAESRLCWSGACTELREPPGNNLPIDRSLSLSKGRAREVGKLFLAASLSRSDSQSRFVTNLTCAEPVEVWQ
jgi:hypothetical protein